MPHSLTQSISLSIIIPCKNEVRHIARCIDSVLVQDNDSVSLEVRVVDNGSSDGTLELLKAYGPRIIVDVLPHASVGDLRNYAAGKSSAEWLAFIDADVELSRDWLLRLTELLTSPASGCDALMSIFGSTCEASPEPEWVERLWVRQLAERDRRRSTYINSGHLVVSRKLFQAAGGFPGNLAAGEDVAFCANAVDKGAKICKASILRAVHHGYPKTLGQFYRRERWHGLGMRLSLRNILVQRELGMAAFYLFILLFALAWLPFAENPAIIATTAIFALVCPLFILALHRGGDSLGAVLGLTILYGVYTLAHVVSLVQIILMRKAPSKQWRVDCKP